MSIISSNHRLVKVSYDGDQYSAGPGIVIEDSTISVDPNLSAAIDDKLDTSAVGLRLWLDGKNIVSGIGGSALFAECSRSAWSAQYSQSTLRDEDGYYLTTTYTKNSALNDVSSTLSGAIDYLSGNAGKTYSGIAPIVVNNDTNEISADTQDISFGVGLDFTGGVLSVTAQGGDPEVETVVKTNSGYWNEVSSISSTSSVLNNQITAVRNDLNTVSTNTGYLYNDIQTTSGILSAAIDDISANMPEGFTGVNHDNNLSGDGKSIPLGLASSIKLQDPSIYTTATYGGSISIEGIMPRLQLKTNNSSYNTLGEGGMTVTHPASSVGGGYTTSHYGEKMSLSYNDGDYYLHTVDTTKSGLGVTYKGAPNVKAYYNYSGVALTNDNGATNEYVNVASIRNWNSVYDTVESNSASWAGGTSLTGDAQGAVDEVYANSAIWNEITGVSSNYVSQTDLEQISGDLKNDIDYVSANAITSLDGYATTSEVNTVSSYLSGQIDNKLDSTSFNPNDYYPMVGNPSGFISGVDLSDYQTKAGMTAYQPAGDYATTGDLYNTSSILSGAIDYISGNAGTTYTGVAPIVVTGNTISADSFDLAIGSGLAFENNTLYVSAQAGDPEVESYVQTNSATIDDTITNVTTNSGAWGGSALLISAGPGIKLEMVNNTLVASNDETLLWSGTAQGNISLNEPITNFERIGIDYGRAENFKMIFVDVSHSASNVPLQTEGSFSNGYASIYTQSWKFTNATTFTSAQAAKEWWGKDGLVSSRDTTDMPVYKVIGINRIAGGN